MLIGFLAGILAFVLVTVLMPQFITYYKLKNISGQQMHEDVKQHLEKSGTPTMGGTVFILVSFLVTGCFSLITFWGKPQLGAIGANLFVLLIYGAIGFLDDFFKIFKNLNEGLTPRQKLGLQLLGGLVFYAIHVVPSGTDSFNVFGLDVKLGLLHLPFLLFWLVGFSNAVNLTDGIDGLSSVSVVISLMAYSVIAIKQNQLDVLLLNLTMIGGLLGFFLFNKKPAKVFMGDVGSLALGAMLAAISITLHQEWTLLLIGLVYVVETASVILQVSYFKYTKKKYGEGRRIFRMTPLHHHLELGGLTGKGNRWSEWQVDTFLWAVGGVGSLLALLLLFLL